MIPLRRLLIVEAHDELPYPEGTACAEVLRATAGEGAAASVWIFRGMAVGAAVKLLISLAFLFPGELRASRCPCCRKAELALELAPALLGVGFILGYRQSAVLRGGLARLGAGARSPLIAWLGAGLTAPLSPETKRLVRRHERRPDLVALRALHRRRRRGHRRHPDRAARPADDGGRVPAVARGLRSAGAAGAAAEPRAHRPRPARLRS